MGLANAGHRVDLKQRWGHSEKRLVPLEASVADAIRTAIYSGQDTGDKLTLHHISPVPDTIIADLSVHGGPPCCDSTHKTSATLLLCQNIP